MGCENNQNFHIGLLMSEDPLPPQHQLSITMVSAPSFLPPGHCVEGGLLGLLRSGLSWGAFAQAGGSPVYSCPGADGGRAENASALLGVRERTLRCAA